jgi:soluble lytic murein transglycosylase-like protein
VLPATGAWLRLDIDHAGSKVLAGARYLRVLLDRFQSPDLALAGYNAGPTAVAKAGGAPTPQTRRTWRTSRKSGASFAVVDRT